MKNLLFFILTMCLTHKLYPCDVLPDSSKISMTIKNNPTKVGDSVILQIENLTNDTLTFNVEMYFNHFFNDSLIFKSIVPITSSIFCKKISANVYHISCFKTLRPREITEVTLTEFIWENFKNYKHKGNIQLVLRANQEFMSKDYSFT